MYICNRETSANHACCVSVIVKVEVQCICLRI